MRRIPKSLRGIFWSRKIEGLDLRQDKDYVIHHVLAYGNLGQLKWLLGTFTKREVLQSFLKSPRKNYTPAAFNFVKDYILKLKNKEIDPRPYVKTLF